MKTKLFSPAICKGVIDKEKQIVHVITSTGVIDRHGDSVNPSGWKLQNFNDNPVVLVAHDYWTLPVGKVIKSWVEDNALHQHIQLAKTEEGKKVFYLVEGGFLNTVSAGFIVTKWGVSGEDEYTIMEQELLEVSFVAVPANPEALVQNDVKDEFKYLYKSLETKGTQKVITMSEQELRSAISEEIEKVLGVEKIIEAIEKLIQGVKITEEKTVEKIVYVKGIPLSENATTLLLHIQKQAEKSAKKADATSELLKSLLNVTNSIEGGDR